MPPPTVQRVTVRATVPTSSSLNALQEQTIIARWLQIIASRSGQTLVEKAGAARRRPTEVTRDLGTAARVHLQRGGSMSIDDMLT